MSDNPMFLYVGEYESVEDAKVDLEALKELHRESFVGTHDAAVLTKNEDGKVEIADNDWEAHPARRMGWVGGRRGDWPHLPSFSAGKRTCGC